MRRIAIVTGSRGEYGYIRPIIRLIEQEPELEYKLIVTNMHLLPGFGYSVDELEKDNIPISDRIYMALDGYTPASVVKSLGGFLWSFTDTLLRLKPDILLLAGDRGEQLMGAIAGAHMNIPVAHIQAGEVSGHIDGQSRHAIARFTHIHFASNEDAAERLIKTGEEPFRVYKTGAPQLDELVKGEFDSPDEITLEFKLDLDEPVILVAQHPTSEEYDRIIDQIKETFEALLELEHQTLIIFPNNDACNETIRLWIEEHHRPFMQIYRNLPRHKYLGLMNVASVMVGNSSSGLIEAPTFNLPVVNIGERQRGRARGVNVISVSPDRQEILSAMKQALEPKFKEEIKKAPHPYSGDGHVAERIVDILRDIPLDEKLLKKRIMY